MDNKFDMGHVPIFRPTWEEFKDFNKYIKQIEDAGAHHAGICKIIPPKCWVPRKSGYDNLDDLIIKAPIKQKAHGSHGIFLQTLHVKSDMSVRQIRDLSNSPAYRTPDHNDWSHLEKKYWANIGLSTALYGADVCGSITDSDMKHWNIAHLGSILDCVFEDTGVQIKGVNTPYLYFGTWRATFAWHIEDVDLYSINYLHYGMPKRWYVIPPAYAIRFETLAKEYYKSDFIRCQSFLRHKTCLIAPSVLQAAGIPVNRMTQEQGEIMITFPYGYHSGYNLGFNIAESTNFASSRWIEFGKKCSVCHCRPDSVKIQMDPFVRLYQPELWPDWLNGRDTVPHPLVSMYGEMGLRRKRRALRATAVTDGDGSGSCSSVHAPGKSVQSTLAAGEKQRRHCGIQGRLIKKRKKNNSDVENKVLSLPEFLTDFPGLWSFEPRDWEAEKSFNEIIGQQDPHCAVCCVLWTPPRVQDVLTQKSAPPSNFPARSEPAIPEDAYAKNLDCPDDDLLSSGTSSPSSSAILRCTSCALTVHARCYGAVDMDSTSKPATFDQWKCDRCAEGESEAQCCMCPVRSGALKRLAPVSRDGRPIPWVHIICALGTWDVRYVSIRKRLALLPPYQPEWTDLECALCEVVNDSAPLAKCVYAACKTHLHVTCAHLAGVLIESLDKPWSFYITCKRHKKLYAKFNVRSYPTVSAGDAVYAKHPYNHRYYKAIAKEIESSTLYCIEFLDGSYSNDVPIDFIQGRDCKKDGPPPEGTLVHVIWNDDIEYQGIFRGLSLEKWEIEFETGELVHLSRDMFYKTNEDIPPRIQRRISTYSEKDSDN